jgi:hypothetical protein
LSTVSTVHVEQFQDGEKQPTTVALPTAEGIDTGSENGWFTSGNDGQVDGTVRKEQKGYHFSRDL